MNLWGAINRAKDKEKKGSQVMKNMARYEKDILENVGDAFDGKTAPRFLKQVRRHLTVDSRVLGDGREVVVQGSSVDAS
jgi:hypothetical protein